MCELRRKDCKVRQVVIAQAGEYDMATTDVVHAAA